MRTAAWETSAGALAAFLNSTTQVYMADLFTFTTQAGVVIARYTSADVAVTVNGNTYATGPAITRGKTKRGVGVAVDTLDVTLAADASVTLNGKALLPFIAAGGFDNCRLTLDRAFAAGPSSAWVGMLNLFAGRISDTQITRYEARLAVASDSELLNVMVPRNVYQPACANTLFDGSCGLAKTGYCATATATSATDAPRTTFTASALGGATGLYSLGWAVGLTGPNAGVGRTIKVFTSGGVIQTIQPWPSAVAIGNTFTVYQGCDKTMATCNSKFGNLLRFRGQPFVPPPETVM